MASPFLPPEGIESIDVENPDSSQQSPVSNYEQPMDVKKTDRQHSEESFDGQVRVLIHGDTPKVKKEPDQTSDVPDVVMQEETKMMPEEGLTHEIVASEPVQDTLEPMIPESSSQELDMPGIPHQERAEASYEEATEATTLDSTEPATQESTEPATQESTEPAVPQSCSHEPDVMEGLEQETNAKEGAARNSATPDLSSQDAKPQEDTAAAMQEAMEPILQQGPSHEPDVMEGLQEETDMQGGAARSSTTPRPLNQDQLPQEPIDTVVEEAAEAPMQDEMPQESTTPGEAPQELSETASKTAQPQNIDLGPSVLNIKLNGAFGGQQTAEQLEKTQSEQLKMSKILKQSSKSTKEHQTASAAETRDDQLDTHLEDSYDLEVRYREEEKLYARKVRKGTNKPDDEMRYHRAVTQYSRHQRSLRVADDTVDHLFVPVNSSQKKKSRKRKSAANGDYDSDEDGSSVGPRKRARKPAKPRKNVPATAAHVNLGRTTVFTDAATAEGMQGQFTFKAGTRRDDTWKAAKANVPREKQQAFAADKLKIEKAIRNFKGQGSVGLHDLGHWTVKGMSTPLKAHQIVQAGWMVSRETYSDPKGGILADSMGLGKTLTSLALITNTRPLSKELQDGEPRTTLVVVPTSLLDQWRKEIRAHCEVDKKRINWGIGQILTFRDAMSEDFETDDFANFDIVLTTYSDVMQSWPNCKFPENTTEEERSRLFREKFLEKRGPLHRNYWKRVILDEGHQIRNSETRTARACFALIADHNWILSGTPLMNGAHELYSLFTFIKHPKVLSMKLESFKRQFCSENNLSLESLSQELLQCMGRYTHADSLLNSRLVTLPNARSVNLTLRFSPLEQTVYDVVQQRFRNRAQTTVCSDGSVSTKMTNIMTLILRLRQLTAHPLLLPPSVCKFLEREDFEKIESALVSQPPSEEYGEDTIRSLRQLVRYRETRQQKNSRSEIRDLDTVTELEQPAAPKLRKTNDTTGEMHGKSGDTDYRVYVKSMKRSAFFQCGLCNNTPIEPVEADCGHVYCRIHLEFLLTRSSLAKKEHADCEVCGEEIVNTDAGQDETELPQFLASSALIPSAKTYAIKSQILEWRDKKRGGDPKRKIIIFTQWVGMLQILIKLCEDEGWKTTTLSGKMKPAAKLASINTFNTDPEVPILICTLKTGGQGLNLTVASRVINVDPYWNDAVEQQAFCRVYRIGQERETDFRNLTVKSTIDEHLKLMKQRKSAEIDKLIKDHKSRNLRLCMQLLDPVPEAGSSEEDDPMEDSPEAEK